MNFYHPSYFINVLPYFLSLCVLQFYHELLLSFVQSFLHLCSATEHLWNGFYGAIQINFIILLLLL
ncbi:hypothetical protein CAPTEDRAFT_147424 [Capitella teleta]|uniref:Uncharacterized protein n=1 Tax=Capitella teleta TaxID=283909 RepID=R7UU40_CAPTE|nr:hypothetical protein CAPTEDRAFT_147424 [Capitella teleta]|eukprot:ELU09663.1 hypothetical protein CAPTEDRAFT_147424 [Capitella teleta]